MPSSTGRLLRPVRVRRARGQSSLELLFDLAFSAASGFAAVQLAQTMLDGRPGAAIVGFAAVFFAIWWAWLNFSWFTSAYETDDGLTWLVTGSQILGACVLAAGVPDAVTEQDFTVITIGYAVMRLPLIAQWCRAAVADPAHRATCLRYATGLVALQAGWLARLALPEAWLLPGFLLLAAAELAVPSLAERRGPVPTSPSHLAGRYARFTLTVAAQVIAAVVFAFQAGIDHDQIRTALVTLAALSVAVVATLLWLYSTLPHSRLATGSSAIGWQYGHYPLVGAVGAIAGGVRFLAERLAGPDGTGTAVGAERWAAYPLAAAVAVVLLALWLCCVVPATRAAPWWVGARYPAAALLAALAPVVIPGPLWAVGAVVLVLLLLATSGALATREPAGLSRH